MKKNKNIKTLNMKRAVIIYFHTNSLFFCPLFPLIRVVRASGWCVRECHFSNFCNWFGYTEKKRVESAYVSLCVDSHELKKNPTQSITLKNTYTKIAKVVKKTVSLNSLLVVLVLLPLLHSTHTNVNPLTDKIILWIFVVAVMRRGVCVCLFSALQRT